MSPSLSEKQGFAPSSARFIRSLKGVRHWWPSRPPTEPNMYAKEAVAMTLTAEFRPRTDPHTVTLLHPDLHFVPHGGHLLMLSNDAKAFVHYEPKRAHVAMGTNPDTKSTKSLWLTVEEYAWLIQQLQEEQGVHEALKSANHSTSASMLTAWGLGCPMLTPAPMLGVINAQICTRTLARRLARWVQRAKQRSVPDLYRQCIFMLPKALLLQAAAYIPMTKPLPSLDIPLPIRHTLKAPFYPLSLSLHQRLSRYCQYIACTSHSFVIDTTTTSSFASMDINHAFHPLICRECHYQSCLESILDRGSANQVMDPTFPVSLFQTIWHPASSMISTSDQRGSAFETLPTQSGHLAASKKCFSAIECSNESNFSDTTVSSIMPSVIQSEKRGYIAIDHQHEEIVVVFPGLSSSDALFDHASFMPVPWQEADIINNNEAINYAPWVLDCALAAWRRCELHVATYLMRVCQTVPNHYRVVIVGHSLGGGMSCGEKRKRKGKRASMVCGWEHAWVEMITDA
ncbi:uncharacterized protein BYT42DRAFT_502377 [Radiomyces spectabilis]|uniref:uncharacterized protein n=1 Tax=Radiomyces spectabilis TaxID=64574 RepID=UPI002220E39D|nr:uncharacterized protein BYT42DRAFT_502377 [Radiomyces spectabilis]KAI8370579.1 hypothetical protein BYT42DRAFT_502377 [Radiomyces spectabilis]